MKLRDLRQGSYNKEVYLEKHWTIKEAVEKEDVWLKR